MCSGNSRTITSLLWQHWSFGNRPLQCPSSEHSPTSCGRLPIRYTHDRLSLGLGQRCRSGGGRMDTAHCSPVYISVLHALRAFLNELGRATAPRLVPSRVPDLCCSSIQCRTSNLRQVRPNHLTQFQVPVATRTCTLRRGCDAILDPSLDDNHCLALRLDTQCSVIQYWTIINNY